MSLVAPNLDDRKFQDIVSEARSLIPRYCPEWTDHNLSDPGITFIELFAWMVDILLYRLNQVPERNYIKFLDLIGVKLLPAQPSKAYVTFRLSAPQSEPVTIPRGTEVATVRTETQDAITFTTDNDLQIVVARMTHCLISRAGGTFHDFMPVLKTREVMDIFQKEPQENDSFYVGFSENLAGNTLRLTFEASIEGIGVDPRRPPVAWEFWDAREARWGTLRVESDSTGGLNRDGEVILHVPHTCDFTEVDGKYTCWIRCRVIKPQPRQPSYTTSPRVRSVLPSCIGGTVSSSHSFRVANEVLGRSNGSAGQIFHLQNVPVLPRDKTETLEVEKDNGEWEPWQEIEDFSTSGAGDHHFMCDSVSGEIKFGPRLRQPNGEERQFGTIPSKGKRVRFSSYRCGGGVKGNVGDKTLTVLKSSIPYVAWVTNFEAATGGTDSETLGHAKLRAPALLKGRTRAVTAEDFEYLAYEASADVARAKCLIPGGAGEKGGVSPGTVRLLIVPRVPTGGVKLSKEQLAISEQLQRRVLDYLDERRLLTVQLDISPPDYQWVCVQAKVKTKSKSDSKRVKLEIEKRLYQHINPVSTMGDTSWPFGRDILASDLFPVIQEVPGVDYVEDIKLFSFDMDTGRIGDAASKLTLSEGQLPCSHEHAVMLVQDGKS